MTLKLIEIFKYIKNSIIQNVPNELYACEICKKTKCNNIEWNNCEYRISHMKRLDDLENNRVQN